MKFIFLSIFLISSISLIGQDTILLEIAPLVKTKLVESSNHYYSIKSIEEFPFPSELPSGILMVKYDNVNQILLTVPTSKNQLNGEMKIYYPNGKIRERVNFIDGKFHGVYIFFNKNGGLKTSIEYVHGKKNGYECDYFSSSFLSDRIHFDKGIYTGKREAWHPNGVKQFELSELYQYGPSDGKTIYWSDKGIKLAEGNYKGVYPIGEMTTFYKNGQMKKRGRGPSYLNDSLPENHYNIRIYFRRDVTGEYIKDAAIYEEWYEDGQVKTKLLPNKENELILEVEKFYPNGIMKEKGNLILTSTGKFGYQDPQEKKIEAKTWEKIGSWNYWNEAGIPIKK